MTKASATSMANGEFDCWANKALPLVRCVFQSVSPLASQSWVIPVRGSSNTSRA